MHRLALVSVILALAALVGCRSEQQDLRTWSEEIDEAAQPEVEETQAEPQGSLAESPEIAAAPETVPPESETESPGAEPAEPVAEAPVSSVAVAAAPSRPPRAPLPQRIADATAESNGVADSLTTAMARVADGEQPAPTESSEPREIELLIPHKDFLRVKPDNALRVSYDDIDLLKVLNMEPVPEDAPKHFPDWLSGLDGQLIRIRGFMVPPPREHELPGFTLARDNAICCFGRDPKPYDIIPVFLKEGVTTDYIPNRPFDVVGRFYVRPFAYSGELESLYEIEDAIVIKN